VQIAAARVSDVEQAVTCLVEAFADDPQMACFFPVEKSLRPEAIRSFFSILMEARLALNMPVLLAVEDGEILGAIMGYDTNRPEWLPEHSRRFVDLETRNEGLVDRLRRADDLMTFYQPAKPHYYLGVVGVAEAAQGHGVGQKLIGSFLDMSDADPLSDGTFLETANERNLAFYQRLGFSLAGYGEVDHKTRLWCLYRPKQRRE